MGLLSDLEVGSGWWGRAVKRAGSPVCVLAWAVGVAWLFALMHPSLNNRTYFSENALLPGLVRSDISRDGLAEQIYRELLHELEDKYSSGESIPVPWLVGKMSQLGLETYTHNYTLEYPFGQTQTYQGTNVYGMVRAPRAPALEALVVSAPYRAPSSHHTTGTVAGIALMLAYAHLARSQPYWAKDLIFLVTEHEQLGAQAWLEAYHHHEQADEGETWAGSLAAVSGGGGGEAGRQRWRRGRGGGGEWLRAGRLPARSGAIQAAINLEIDTPDIKYVEVKAEGLNGQLCNLDLVNLAHRMCSKARLPHAYRTHLSWRPTPAGAPAPAPSDLLALLEQLLQHAPGAPSGNHGLFHRYGIEAVTLAGGGGSADAAPLPPAGWHSLSVLLEGTLRSLNNLLERFHQSYFFYLLIRIDRFVSIGQYMPSLCLPVGALLVRALALWLGDGGEGRGALAAPAGLYLALHAVGCLMMAAPLWLARLGAEYGWPTEASVYWGVCAGSVAWAAGAAAAGRRAAAAGRLLAPAILELATLCLSIGLASFPLGLLLAALYTPLALLVRPQRSTGAWLVWCTRVVVLLLHPLVLLTLSLAVYSRTLYPSDSVRGSLGRGVVAAQQALVLSVLDYLIYGNWLWSVCCVLLTPVWSVLWLTTWTPTRGLVPAAPATPPPEHSAGVASLVVN